MCGNITCFMVMKNDGGLSAYGSSLEGVEIRNRKRRKLEWLEKCNIFIAQRNVITTEENVRPYRESDL